MCRNIEEGGRRCSHGTEYDRIIRNLKAKRQYHNRKGNLSEAAAISENIVRYETRSEQLRQLGSAKIYPHKIELSENTEKLLSTLRAEGFTPYVVGGTVRDALTGEQIKDVDIEVYGAETDSLKSALRRLSRDVDEVGQQFGVLKVQLGGEEFDVSLPRTENRTGASHTSFEVHTDRDMTIAEASARRDYTVNALLYDNELEHIVDPQSGVEDWKNRTLKHVSDAFDEDPLRVLRGTQMAARFNMVLHPDTVLKAEGLTDQFPNIAKERVQIEFQKLFTKSFHPEKGFKVLKDTGWDKNLPGLSSVDAERLHQNLSEAGQRAYADNLDDESRATFFGAVTAFRIPESDRRNFLSYITVGDKIKNRAYLLASIESPSDIKDLSLRNWARDAPSNITFEDWVRVQRIVAPETKEYLRSVEDRAKELRIWDTHEQDLIKGDQLMEALNNPRPGKWVGSALRKIRTAQFNNEFRTSEDGLAWISANKNLLTED